MAIIHREKTVFASALDAMCTFFLHEEVTTTECFVRTVTSRRAQEAKRNARVVRVCARAPSTCNNIIILSANDGCSARVAERHTAVDGAQQVCAPAIRHRETATDVPSSSLDFVSNGVRTRLGQVRVCTAKHNGSHGSFSNFFFYILFVYSPFYTEPVATSHCSTFPPHTAHACICRAQVNIRAAQPCTSVPCARARANA